jgi:hypothetical protein
MKLTRQAQPGFAGVAVVSEISEQGRDHRDLRQIDVPSGPRQVARTPCLVCRELDWRHANGELRLCAGQNLLGRLPDRGVIELPPYSTLSCAATRSTGRVSWRSSPNDGARSMKRTGRLFARIIDRDNLRVAFGAALRGKRGRPDARRFSARADEHLRWMAAELDRGALPWVDSTSSSFMTRSSARSLPPASPSASCTTRS